MLRRVFQVVLPLVLWLVGFDLVGVAACFVFDVLPLRGNSAALPFAIWFVLGVFCGLFVYFQAESALSAGDEKWPERAHGTATGTFIIAISALCLAAPCVVFYRLWWKDDWLGDSYVPDSGALTLTFFGAILASMLLARHVSKPDPPPHR